MRLVILGGGGFRVPLVHARLLADPLRLVREVVLHDVDAARLGVLSQVLDQQASTHPSAARPVLRVTTDLDAALSGADMVFAAIRVGGLAGRVLDERVALAHGVLGQETVGAGGISYGLRTIPVVMDIARRLARLAPDAWLINFTNPAGMVTEAMSTVLGPRVIGICDSPVGLCRRVAESLGVPPARAWFDYVGLNHLGWLRAVVVSGRDVLPTLLADDAALASFEEGRLFGADRLRALRAVPNEYLHYYYRAAEIREVTRRQQLTRGEFLRTQQDEFYRRATDEPGSALRAWRDTRAERERTYLAEGRTVAGSGDRSERDTEGGGYDLVALELMAAITTNRATTLILNVPNRGAVSGMDSSAVVEVPCVVDGNGARPFAMDTVDEHCLGLMRAVKESERATIDAATKRSRRHAITALATHPLVGAAHAEPLLDAYLAAFPDLDMER